MPPLSVTIVVPAKDEEETIGDVLVGARPYGDEILVIDGHSQDKTREITLGCGAHVILDNGRGKGAALRKGIQQARGDVLVFIDADGSHDPNDIPRLLAPIRAGEADHVSASRMLGGSYELHGTRWASSSVSGAMRSSPSGSTTATTLG